MNLKRVKAVYSIKTWKCNTSYIPVHTVIVPWLNWDDDSDKGGSTKNFCHA